MLALKVGHLMSALRKIRSYRISFDNQQNGMPLPFVKVRDPIDSCPIADSCSATGYVSKLPGNLLDHLVGAHEQELSHFYARRLRSFKITDFMRAIGS
jgi:hypothetical protein